MNADPGMAYLNNLIDDMFMADVRRYAREVHAFQYKDVEAVMDPDLEDQSSAASGQAQDEYEGHLIGEARAIVNGASRARPTVEHLRVLVNRLTAPSAGDAVPF